MIGGLGWWVGLSLELWLWLVATMAGEAWPPLMSDEIKKFGKEINV